MKGLKAALVIAAVAAVAAIAAAYSGFYNVAADEPHWGITYWFMVTTRQRSIAVRARGVGAPPALDDPELLAMGAEHYAEMCTGCHLAPGMEESEMSAGLYPRPPKLTEPAPRRTAAETFWIVKHGVKMSGMPAWGATHDDRSIWGLVAFVRKLPELSPAEYEEMVARGRSAGHGDEPEPHEHLHDSDRPHDH
jgi:mono/diheme cytochrome c family protein